MIRAFLAACALLPAPASAAPALLEPPVVDQEQIFEIPWRLGVVLLPGERSYFDVPVPHRNAPDKVRIDAWIRVFGTRAT
jgi:hypothetical protein